MAADPTQDTAPVRPGEDLDLEALQAYLTGKVPGAEDGLRLEQFPSGHSNLTYLLTVGDGKKSADEKSDDAPREYVLRRAPLGPVAPKAHDMVREYRILDKLAPHYAPAPRVYHLCEDPAVVGAVFYLMERRHGLVLRGEVPPTLAALPDYGARVSRTLVGGLAALHAIDIERTGLVNLGKPEGFLERQVEGWARRWEGSKTAELPDLERVIAYLRDHYPEPNAPTLVHNDYKLDNVMLGPGDPDRLVAVLDWEMTTVGDPLVDVGLSLVYWQGLGTLTGDATLGAAGANEGWFSREQFLAHYAAASGRDLEDITWYELLGVFKLAVILQQIYARYVTGQTQDVRFRDFGHRVAELASVGAARLP